MAGRQNGPFGSGGGFGGNFGGSGFDPGDFGDFGKGEFQVLRNGSKCIKLIIF